ncbi:MAG: universal stress protein [Burkholderiaceae bacterium]|nr:universal stress protein [Burkholderiaceae bacterium]
MKILLAADGSKFTKKALAFLMTHEGLAGPTDELVVLHVQAPVPSRVAKLLGTAAIKDYHADEAAKVLGPIERFLARHPVRSRCTWKVGIAADEIVSTAKSEKAHMIVMGTHGHGLVGRALLGSVAQKVVTQCDIPLLLVK